jgi:hypothetical protein
VGGGEQHPAEVVDGVVCRSCAAMPVHTGWHACKLPSLVSSLNLHFNFVLRLWLDSHIHLLLRIHLLLQHAQGL